MVEAEREEKDEGNIRIKYISKLIIAVSCIVSFIAGVRSVLLVCKYCYWYHVIQYDLFHGRVVGD